MTRRDDFLSFSPPSIGDEERAAVLEVLGTDWITTGPRVGQFESAFGEFIGAPAALAVNSCTAALHTALASMGIQRGDAVITTPMTFCSSVHVIEHLGARPVLVDVEPDTLNIDPNRVFDAIRKWDSADGQLKAILPVHLHGHPCEVDDLLDLAREYGLHVVEDAAHALPAAYKGRRVGEPPADPFWQEPDGPHIATCFSFYATKNLTTGEGGMLAGAPSLIEEARLWSLHGMSKDSFRRYSANGSWSYEVVRPGFKYNMTDVQAAIGGEQLKKLPGFQERRRSIVRLYNEAFRGCDALELPVERPEVEHAWHIYAIRLVPGVFGRSAEDAAHLRSEFIEEMRARNIGTSVHFIPIHLHEYYQTKYGFAPSDFPVALAAYERLVSLPLHPRLTEEDVTSVIEAVSDVVRTLSK